MPSSACKKKHRAGGRVTRRTLDFFLMIRRPPRSTRVRSSAASDVYKRQSVSIVEFEPPLVHQSPLRVKRRGLRLSLIHISEPTRLLSISYAVFCLKKK